jgi:hypothetical protein
MRRGKAADRDAERAEDRHGQVPHQRRGTRTIGVDLPGMGEEAGNVACRLPAAGGANTMSTKVPPPIMNQVLTSALLTTSPRLIASSSRFGVGSSVRSVSSRSSAIELCYPCGASALSTPPA